MPMSHRHFLLSSITQFRTSSPFRIVICHFQLPPRALHQSTSSYTFSYSPTFWFHDTSMGHAHLVWTQILFFFLEKGLVLTILPLPPTDHSCSSSLHSSLQWNSQQNKHLCISYICMLLNSHIRGHVLSLKNCLKHCTQWLKKDINSSNN